MSTSMTPLGKETTLISVATVAVLTPTSNA
jgi:hypothetical protein